MNWLMEPTVELPWWSVSLALWMSYLVFIDQVEKLKKCWRDRKRNDHDEL